MCITIYIFHSIIMVKMLKWNEVVGLQIYFCLSLYINTVCQIFIQWGINPLKQFQGISLCAS